MRTRKAVLILLLLPPLVATALILRQPKIRAVRMIPVEQGAIVSGLTVTGTVVAQREVTLTAVVPGVIAELPNAEGDAVEAGRPVATLDTRNADAEVKKARYALQLAEAELMQAKRSLARSQRLFAAGGEAGSVVDDDELRVDIAEAKARSAVEALRSAQIERDNLVVRAPFHGIVIRKQAEVGQVAGPATPLLTIADMAAREIEVMIDAADAVLVRPNQLASISVDSAPGANWGASVLRLAPKVSSADSTNTIPVRLSIGKQAPPLTLGQQVDVKLEVLHKENVARVPISAVQTIDGRTVMATVNDGRISYREVSTGIEDLAHIEIVKGAKPGDLVVLPAGGKLKEGELVKPVSRNTP